MSLTIFQKQKCVTGAWTSYCNSGGQSPRPYNVGGKLQHPITIMQVCPPGIYMFHMCACAVLAYLEGMCGLHTEYKMSAACKSIQMLTH